MILMIFLNVHNILGAKVRKHLWGHSKNNFFAPVTVLAARFQLLLNKLKVTTEEETVFIVVCCVNLTNNQ